MQKVLYQDLGEIAYQKAWDLQQSLVQELIEAKRAAIKEELDYLPKNHHLLFCEHPHTYTLGKGGTEDNLLASSALLAAKGAEFVKINRGGDITYHGPGQLVGYPIFDMDYFFNDVHKYVRFLEEAVILLLTTYGLEGLRIEGKSGVWLAPTQGIQYKKIMAVGIHMSRWVTMHGFALNVSTDMTMFDMIVPCGIQEPDKTVTSLSQELGRVVEMDEVKARLKDIYRSLFNFEYT